MTDTEKSFEGERIAKVIAASGVCSRREAEKLIAEGVVKVDGVKVLSPALNVTLSQVITVKGKVISKPERARLWLYHKPRGLITTHKDPDGRPTVFQSLPKELGRVISVGRLDLNSEGLLLLTNSGELARYLELPSTGWRRRYRVRYLGPLDERAIERITNGIEIDGVRYGPAEFKHEKADKNNKWATISLTEGKNREIRKILEHFDCKVSRLVRLSYGPFHLGKIERGGLIEVTLKQLTAAVPKEVLG
jgi:23S rRNA pseudouridine2605 synthase